MEVGETWTAGVQNFEGFTPVRRRESTINRRHLQGESDVEWTAQKCNRLLRALTSRVAVLKKDLSRYQSAGTHKVQVSEGKASRPAKRNAIQAGNTDWTRSRKRVRRTYSVRGGGRTIIPTVPREQKSKIDERCLNPGEVFVPTPVLRRARGAMDLEQGLSISCVHEFPSETGQQNKKRPKTRDSEKNFQLSEMMRDLKKKTTAGRYTTYEGIYNGLETLFRTTKGKPKPQRNGARTLLSMCLAAVPRYITQEEAVLDHELEETGGRSAINNKDVSTEVYDDLEAFGSMGYGWKQLRSIVRSHGIQVVSDAVEAGLLGFEFSRILTKLCIHMEALTEGEIILSSILSTSVYLPPKTIFSRFLDDEENQPLSLLWEVVEQRQCFYYQYRQLTDLFSRRLLPISWVATKEFGPVWTRAIQALPSTLVNKEADVFIETILSMLATPNDSNLRPDHYLEGTESILLEATAQTFSSLLTTLSAVVILNRETISKPLPNISTVPEYEHVSGLIRRSVISSKLSHEVNFQGTLLLLADILAEANSPDGLLNNSDIFLNHLRRMKRSPEGVASKKILANFVCSVARCCGRGAFNHGYEHLKRLHLILEHIADGRQVKEDTLMQGIIVDSAFTFAHEVPDKEHFDYAVTLKEKYHISKTELEQSATPGSAAEGSRVGYRWEEGISEWVTATPAVITSRGSAVSICHLGKNVDKVEDEEEEDDEEEEEEAEEELDTPYKPVIRRKMSRVVGRKPESSPTTSTPD